MFIQNHTVFRERRLRLAVFFSFASKFANAGLQILSLPLAAIALGTHDFALYALMLAMAGWLGLANLGLGPSLLKRLSYSRASASNDQETASLVGAALMPSILVSVLAAGLFLVLVWALPAELLLGQEYRNDQADVRLGLTVLALLFLLQSNLSIFESAQLATQEQHLTNISMAAGALGAGAAVFVVEMSAPDPVYLLLAVCLPPVICRLLNAALFVRRHPSMAPTDLQIASVAASWSMIKEGLAFSLAGGAGSFLAHIFPVIVVGRFLSSSETANYAAVMNSIVIASGIIGMVSVPMWGAVSDGVARKDFAWIRHAYLRLLAFGLSVGLLVTFLFVMAGEWIFSMWYLGALSPGRSLLTAAGVYFLLNCWESIHWTMAIGAGLIRQASIIHFVRALVGAALIVVIAFQGGLSESAKALWVMAASVVVMSTLPMWRLTKRAIVSQ